MFGGKPTEMSKAYRILFLGAGFSQPAGLPLGGELFREVRRLLTAKHGSDNHVERDLERYAQYLIDCEGQSLTADSIE
jgi:hypothetical protein